MIPLLPNRQKKQLRAGAETALAFDMRTQLRTIKCGPTKLLFPAFTTANRGYMYRTIATLPKHHTRNTGSILHARINTPLKALRLNAQGKGGGGRYCAGNSHKTQNRSRDPGITSMLSTRKFMNYSWQSINKQNGK